MSESFKNKDRIKFKKFGTQKIFILKAQKFLDFTEPELAEKLKISRRTLREWTKERITISKVAAEKISTLAKLPIPKDHRVINWKLHWQNAGKIGAQVVLKRYGSIGGNKKYRKERWKDWWDKIGKYKKPAPGFTTLMKIKIPRKSILLAEFVGIMLGDGGITKYHISVTLSNTEIKYTLFVSKVIKKLFNIKPKIYKLSYAKAINIVVNRKELVDFCQEMGLVRGNKVKQQVDIPMWIKENKNFSRACMRGLIDTDGCFYSNSYYVNGKKYVYFKIAFTNTSRLLISSMKEALINFGFNARIGRNHGDVRITDSQNVEKYIREIGSHNQKHLQKIKKWKSSKNMLE